MKSQLFKSLGLFTTLMIVVSSMIGSGVFKKISHMSWELGNSHAVLLCWVTAGLITLLGALSNAEVGSRIAQPGGQYVYFKRMYGKLWGFLYGWASLTVIQTATSASVAYVFAESIQSFFVLPNLLEEYSHVQIIGIQPFHNSGVKILALTTVLITTYINTLGVRYGGGISSILASSLIACLILLIGIAFVLEPQTGTQLSYRAQQNPSADVNLSTFFTALLAAFWAFEGWNTIGYLGGEIKNAKRNIPIALGGGVLLVLLLYAGVNGAFLRVLSVDHFAGIHKANEHGANLIPALEVIRNLMGREGVLLLGSIIAISTFNTSNNTIMTSPRVYYAMSKDRLWWQSLANLHPKRRTPQKALWLHAIIACVYIISGSFDALTDMLLFSAFIFYAAGAWGVFVLRKKGMGSQSSIRVPSWIPLVFVCFSIVLVVNSLWVNPVGSLTGLGIVLLGIPIYIYFLKKRAEHVRNYKRRLNH